MNRINTMMTINGRNNLLWQLKFGFFYAGILKYFNIKNLITNSYKKDNI